MDITQPIPYSLSPLIKALTEADAFDHKVTAVQLIETHISWVLLTGQYAYKIKKPVNFGFLDFSSLEKRRFYCQEELRLNRRLAKDWYLDVVPITGQPERPKMNGTGTVSEYAVKMLQFPSALTLRDTAVAGLLDVGLIDQVADIVAHFHAVVDKAEAPSPYGDCQDIKRWSDENFTLIRPLLDNEFQLRQFDTIETWHQGEWADKALLMQGRKQQGHVRECHGDLHLGNMTCIDGQVVLFDCIEFNPMLRWIDVISEVAFLVMDLLHFGFSCYAYRFLNRYLQHTGDYSGLAVLRYYLVYRAMVRAKVALLRVAQHPDIDVSTQARSEFSLFANLADGFVQGSQVKLFITHGFSGSGKSTLASQLAEKIGAIHLRSDTERKRLFGYTAMANTCSGADSGIYTQDASEKIYRHLLDLAKVVIKAGYPVIVDATFLKTNQRDLFQQLADASQVKFVILDIQAGDTTLCHRIMQRKNDVSEATVDVLQHQQQSAEPLSSMEQAYTLIIDTETVTPLETLLTRLSGLI